MKKILIANIILLIISIIILPTILADSPLVIVDTIREEKILDDGIIYQSSLVKTKDIDSSTYTTNEVYSLTFNPSSCGKIVTWSYTSKYNTTLVTLDKIAADYEKNHPGWIVVGGINAEGFHSEGGYNEISNMFVQDGNLMRTGVSSEKFKELIGFYDDNSHIIKRVPTLTETMILRTYNSSVNTSSYTVSSLNSYPEGDGIGLLTLEAKSTLDLTGYYVIQGEYEMYRRNTFYISNMYALTSTDDGVYLKGTINGLVDSTIYKKDDYKFYLITKDEETALNLSAAEEISCQYEFLDEFASCKSVTGYMYKLIENSHVMLPTDTEDNSDDYEAGIIPVDDSFSYNCAYYTTHGKERSAIGFKEDGTIVLLTSNVSTGGPCQYELGNMLSSLGCTNAYQFDGGGSVTFTLRDEYGNFQNINTPGDGSYRNISTGIFLVVPDPSITIESTTRDSITFNYDTSKVKNLRVVINDNIYTLDDTLTITGLEEDTAYELYYLYDILDDNNNYISTRSSTKTAYTKAYYAPSPNFKISNISKYSFVVTRNNTQDNFYDIKIHVGDNVYNMGDDTEYTVTNLFDDTTYEVYIEYSHTDLETSKVYNLIATMPNVTTLDYEIPYIINFEISKEYKDGKVKFNYEYKDPDKLITLAYIEYGEEYYILDTRIGDVSITIDETTSFKLILLYEHDEKETKIESSIITVTVDKQTPVSDESPTNKKKCGKKDLSILIELMSSVSFIYLLIKKYKK